MSAEVVRLNVPYNHIMVTIEDLYGRAKKGEILDMAIAAITKDGDIVTGVITNKHVFTLLGAVTEVSRKIEDEIILGRIE